MCVCVSVSHLYGFGLLDAESMVKEAERWKQVPSQHECVEEAPIQLSRYLTKLHCKRPRLWVQASLHSSPFITLCLFRSQLSHGFSHSLMGVIPFIASPFVPLLTRFLYPSPLSATWQNYSSRLTADVCVWERRLLQRGQAPRCLCGACRFARYHHSRSSWRPFYYTHIPLRHCVAAAGQQVRKRNAQSRIECAD